MTFDEWAILDKDEGMERGHHNSVEHMFTIIKEKMGILQQLTDFTVVSVIKTLHYIEHTAMEMSQSRRSHHDTKDTIEVNEVKIYSINQ